MTAIIGILNKQAVAVAADSAVTISNGNNRKIYNRANKIFTLSKYHPVGIALYNSATFMGVPWETIIKMYREYLGDKSFDKLENYWQDFLKYLQENNYFTTIDEQTEYLAGVIRGLTQDLCNETGKTINIDNEIVQLEQQITNDEFSKFTKNEYSDLFNNTIDEMVNYCDSLNKCNTNIDVIVKIKKLVYLALIKNNSNIAQYTGLTFFGFGNKEIYPTLNVINVKYALKDMLYAISGEAFYSINQQNKSWIVPLAQRDVIDTILNGISSELNSVILQGVDNLLYKYNEELLKLVKNNTDLYNRIINLNSNRIGIIKEFEKNINSIKQQRYIIPLVNTVSHLPKEDMGEMAESLIYLTYLKRRISSEEESVGGPVDVAVISKGDGFVWLRRKHYFDPELNKPFFNNYFKNHNKES